MIVIQNTEIILRIIVLRPAFEITMNFFTDGLVQETQFFVKIIPAIDVLSLFKIFLMWQFSFESKRNFIFRTSLYVTKLHRTLKFNILPEWTFTVQVSFVEAKIIVRQKTFESRIDFHVVVEIDGVNITAAVVDCSF